MMWSGGQRSEDRKVGDKWPGWFRGLAVRLASGKRRRLVGETLEWDPVFRDERGSFKRLFVVDGHGVVMREGWRDLRTGEIGWST